MADNLRPILIEYKTPEARETLINFLNSEKSKFDTDRTKANKKPGQWPSFTVPSGKDKHNMDYEANFDTIQEVATALLEKEQEHKDTQQEEKKQQEENKADNEVRELTNEEIMTFGAQKGLDQRGTLRQTSDHTKVSPSSSRAPTPTNETIETKKGTGGRRKTRRRRTTKKRKKRRRRTRRKKPRKRRKRN